MIIIIVIIVLLFLALTVIILIEVIQYFIPYRGAEVADVIADLTGVALFYFLNFIYRKIFKKQEITAS